MLMEGELSGCWWEAQRCDKVAFQLVRVRDDLDDEYDEPVTELLREVETTSRLLRDLHDLFPIYRGRVHIVLYYLTVVLPCLSKTMRDMMIYIDNDALPSSSQWNRMDERMGDQGGLSLVARFIMYIEFLVQLVRLLSRSILYDPIALEKLRLRILKFRLLRGIPAPPVPVQPHLAPEKPTQQELERRHWAEKIFENPLRSTTGLRHKRNSRCFGPPMVEDRLGTPPGSTVLFKLPFDKNRLSVTLYLHAEGADLTRLLCRWMDPMSNPMYSCYGVHELCVRRRGSSLQFRRWSQRRGSSRLWLALFFITWEKMVLFHASFVALKSRCPLTVSVDAEDFRLTGETKLFRAPIVDDGFEHSLSIFQDDKNGGLRLHAAVWDGELRRCPVWTAFVTYQSSHPGWMVRRSSHRFWVKDLQPYVFCKKYRTKHQIRKGGEFEIYFVTRRDADDFEDIFRIESDHESESEDRGIGPGPGPALALEQ